jgi:hypothetical protein
MGVVTVDFDNYRERIDQARKCLTGFLPCKARISGGREGLHILKTCVDETEYAHALALRERYDDPDRWVQDRLRHGLTGGMLNNTKCTPWIYTSDVYHPHWFNWGKVPGDDNEKLKLLEFLKKKFALDWVEAAQIERTDGGRAIRLTSRHRGLWLRLSDDNSKVHLESDDGRISEDCAAEREEDELNIYCTWSDVKCIENTVKVADRWVDFKNEEDVQRFFDGECVEGSRVALGADVCSVFWHIQFMIGRREPLYRTGVNHKDILTALIGEKEYDGAITTVAKEIDRILEGWVAGGLSIAPSGLSEGVTPKCSGSRRYELEVYDHETNAFRYALVYYHGDIRTMVGDLPADEIKAVLKREAKWEH